MNAHNSIQVAFEQAFLHCEGKALDGLGCARRYHVHADDSVEILWKSIISMRVSSCFEGSGLILVLKNVDLHYRCQQQP
jgi:hypothetical protein